MIRKAPVVSPDLGIVPVRGVVPPTEVPIPATGNGPIGVLLEAAAVVIGAGGGVVDELVDDELVDAVSTGLDVVLEDEVLTGTLDVDELDVASTEPVVDSLAEVGAVVAFGSLLATTSTEARASP